MDKLKKFPKFPALREQPITMSWLMYGIPEPDQLKPPIQESIVLPPVLHPGSINVIQEKPNEGIVIEGFLKRLSEVIDKIEKEVGKISDEVLLLGKRMEDLEKACGGTAEIDEKKLEVKICNWCEGTAERKEDYCGLWYECPDCGMRGPTTPTKEEAIEIWNQITLVTENR